MFKIFYIFKWLNGVVLSNHGHWLSHGSKTKIKTCCVSSRSRLTKAQVKRRISHEPNRMLMVTTKGLSHLHSIRLM